uniref:hypothetical protein n=1 Tax=Pseudomonas sp. BIOMIG1N TaxID=1763882 RepID=UPI0019D39FEF
SQTNVIYGDSIFQLQFKHLNSKEFYSSELNGTSFALRALKTPCLGTVENGFYRGVEARDEAA